MPRHGLRQDHRQELAPRIDQLLLAGIAERCAFDGHLCASDRACGVWARALKTIFGGLAVVFGVGTWPASVDQPRRLPSIWTAGSSQGKESPMPNSEVTYEVWWEGPHPYEHIQQGGIAASHHVLYQFFGWHPVYGPDALLYVGTTMDGENRLFAHDDWKQTARESG